MTLRIDLGGQAGFWQVEVTEDSLLRRWTFFAEKWLQQSSHKDGRKQNIQRKY